jgi:hypothetical protein
MCSDYLENQAIAIKNQTKGKSGCWVFSIPNAYSFKTVRSHLPVGIITKIHHGKDIMAYQNITASLTPADIQEIKAAFATIQKKLPFIVTLSAEERRKLFKMGDKRLAFVNTSLIAAQSNRDILPASFDLDEFVRDYQLAANLTEVLIGLRQLTEQVDDTLMAVGSEAMGSSLTVYDYVKTAAKKTPGLKTIAEQLGERFKAIKSKPAKAAVDS